MEKSAHRVTGTSDPRLIKRLSLYASIAALSSVAIGLSALIGWALHIAILFTWGTAQAIAPNSAACMVLAGVSLWLLRKEGDQSFAPARRLTANTAATIAGLVGLLTLAEYLFGADFGIDRLLTVGPPMARTLMSPIAAGAFVLLAVALIGIDWRTRRGDWPTRFLSGAVMLGAVFGLLGVVLGPNVSSITLSLPAAVSFLALTTGLVGSRAAWAVGGLIASQSRGAKLLRRRRVEQRTAALESEAAERARTEAKLRASEEMVRMLLDGIKDHAVYMLDADGRVASWNVGAARIKGYAAEEIVGEHVSCFYIAADRNRNRPEEALREAATTGRFEEEGWRVRKNGSRFWADAVITPLHEANGALRGYCKVVRDISDRKRADDELNKQAALLNLAHDAIIVRDLESRVVFWNPGAQRLYGWSAGEACGRVTHDLLQTKFPVPLVDIEVMLADKNDWEGELRHRTRDGTEVVVASRWSPQRDEHGAPTAILEINRDITDRKQAEAALGKSEGRLAGIIASAMDAIITVDSCQRIVVFNAAAVRIFRYSEAEALGQPFERLIPARFRSAHWAHIYQFGETGPTNRAMGQLRALWAVRSDGEEFQIEASISQVEVGSEKMFTVILRDVTERKQAEEIRERLAAVVDSSDDAIISKTLDGTIAAWNRSAENLFGYTASEAVGKPMLMLIPAERINEESDILARIRRGESVEHFETVRIRKDGTRIDVSATISPIRDSSGAIVGASKIARDITELKLKAEALRESEERFQAMANGIPQLAWMAEADGSIFWYNQRWYDYTGTTFKQMQAWAWQTVHDPAILPQVLERWKGAIATGQPFEMEFPLRGADGTFRAFLTRVMPFKDSEGRVVRWFGTNTDIAELKQAQERLAAQSESLARQAQELTSSRDALEKQTILFQLVLDSMGEGLIAADRAGHFLLWNNSAKKLMGRSAADVPTEQWTEHYEVYFPDGGTPYPSDHLPLVRALRGESAQLELLIRHPGSAPGVLLEVTARPVNDTRGELLGGVAVLRDITERKRAETALAEQGEELSRQADELLRSRTALETQTLMLESVLDSMSEGLVTTDEQGKFVIWNPAAERMVGLGPVHMSSEEWSAHYGLYLPDTVTPFPAEQNPFQRALQGEVSSTEMFLRNSELSTGIWIESSASPLRDKGGVLRGGVVAFRDITQRKTDEQEIRKLNDELEQRVVERTAQLENVNRQLHDANAQLTEAKADADAASRAKSAFLSTMSHEIRTPMNAVLGYVQLMLRDPTLGPDAEANLKIIGRSGEHLLALINDVLDMSKIEAGRTELNPETFNILQLMNDLAAMFRLRAQAKALRFEMLVNWESVTYVIADEGKIRQVLINLLGNAVKFTVQGGIKIQITLEQRQAGQLWLSVGVEDSGPGIADAEQGRLFEPFSQGSHGLNTQGGTGLGLAISRKYAQLMGGDLTVSSKPGQGSIFRFAIPIERAHTGAGIRTRGLRRVIAIKAGQEATKILVVDNQLENRDWLTKLLTVVGFSVRSADDGEAAIQKWEEWKPRLILMDMHMPVMDGLEATRRIKADPGGKETAIIALTASALDEDRMAVVGSGADGFLAKPCREDELLEKIRALLNVTYDYEEINETDNQPAEGILALSAALGQLPRELVEELLDATLSGSKRTLDKCILKVSETENAGSAHALQRLADKYEYDALARLLEEARRR